LPLGVSCNLMAQVTALAPGTSQKCNIIHRHTHTRMHALTHAHTHTYTHTHTHTHTRTHARMHAHTHTNTHTYTHTRSWMQRHTTSPPPPPPLLTACLWATHVPLPLPSTPHTPSSTARPAKQAPPHLPALPTPPLPLLQWCLVLRCCVRLPCKPCWPAFCHLALVSARLFCLRRCCCSARARGVGTRGWGRCVGGQGHSWKHCCTRARCPSWAHRPVHMQVCACVCVCCLRSCVSCPCSTLCHHLIPQCQSCRPHQECMMSHH